MYRLWIQGHTHTTRTVSLLESGIAKNSKSALIQLRVTVLGVIFLHRIKGTVSRDFQPLGFFSSNNTPGSTDSWTKATLRYAA
jgi:hypothetical protein